VYDFVFGQTIPVAPFPETETCLGLQSKDSEMKIVEGYAIIAYDYNVQPTSSDCLFNMRETLAQKELNMAKNAGLNNVGSFSRTF